MKKILLLTDFSSGYSRSLLKGIVKYAKEFDTWSFHRMPLYYRELYGDEGVVEWAKKWKVDAIVAQLTDINIEILHQLRIPIIVQNYKERYPGISNLTGDYFGTGRLAAEFFLKRGYKNFAYYGFMDTVWMRERGEGFRQVIEKKGYSVHLFNERERDTDQKWGFDAEKVSSWLRDLPKPIALFACDDYYGIQITEVCKMFNISIPDDIAVLGVDNDSLLCNISDPPLSSIELDVQNGGYEAGKILHQFLEGQKQTPVDIVIKPIRVIARKSTERYAVSDKHVKAVLQFIDENCTNIISVDDLIKQVPFSRRALERKFKDETGVTLYQYIQQKRVEQFSDLLVTTELPLVDAALMSGFDDYKNISRIFMKIKGCTPSQFRKNAKIK